MSNPLLELKKQYDELKTDDERQVWRLAHLDGPMAEVFMESEEAQFDHSGVEQLVTGQSQPKRWAQPQSADEAMARYNDMYAEFQERYGYTPSAETAKLAAVGFQGDLLDEAGRDAFYQRVAAYDGRTPQAGDHHRTQMASGRGGSLSDRMAAATSQPTVEQDNDNWVRELREMQGKAGFRGF